MTLLTAATTGLAEPRPKPPTTWPAALRAGFLSLLFPGTGQLLNRQPRKAVLLALPAYISTILLVKTRLPFAFWTIAPTVLLGLAWRFFVAAEAAYAAATRKPPESPVPMPWLTYGLLAVALAVPALIPYDLPVRAFKTPSASMYPTICIGERIVADMHAYQFKSPQRGDLILLKYPTSNALFIKRVIGLPGDTIGPGADGGVVVGGRPFVPPQPCGGSSPAQRPNPGDYPAFKSAVVPEGTFFVVGDNLGNSFDSRIPEFAPVTPDMLRGKPLYLYWSPIPQRIGCPLR